MDDDEFAELYGTAAEEPSSAFKPTPSVGNGKDPHSATQHARAWFDNTQEFPGHSTSSGLRNSRTFAVCRAVVAAGQVPW